MISDFLAHYQSLFLGYIRLSLPEYYFLYLFSYFFLFFLFLRLSTFKSLNALYLNFEPLKTSGRTSVGLIWAVPDWGDTLQSGPPKFRNFKLLQLDGSNFWNG